MPISLIKQLDQDANPPAWLAAVVVAEQKIFDVEYASALSVYESGVNDWRTNNMVNRAEGKPLTAPPSPPQKEIAYAAEGNVFKQYTAGPDSDIQAPTLAPPIKTSPTIGSFSSGATANTDTQNAMLQTILNVVLALQAKFQA